MATLAALGAKTEASDIRVVEFTQSPLTNVDGVPYWELKLKKEIQVGCSTDVSLGKIPFDSLYCLETIKDSDKWEGTAEEGFTIPGFIADFSKSHGVALYQDKPILAWARSQRDQRKTEGSERIAKIIAGRRAASANSGK